MDTTILIYTNPITRLKTILIGNSLENCFDSHKNLLEQLQSISNNLEKALKLSCNYKAVTLEELKQVEQLNYTEGIRYLNSIFGKQKHKRIYWDYLGYFMRSNNYFDFYFTDIKFTGKELDEYSQIISGKWKLILK